MTSSPWVPMDPVDPRMMTVELEAMLTVPSSYRHCSVWGTTGRGYPNRSYRQAGTAAGTNRWNRAYPGDVFFPISLTQGWTLAEKMDFPGNSHACITEEIYKK